MQRQHLMISTSSKDGASDTVSEFTYLNFRWICGNFIFEGLRAVCEWTRFCCSIPFNFFSFEDGEP